MLFRLKIKHYIELEMTKIIAYQLLKVYFTSKKIKRKRERKIVIKISKKIKKSLVGKAL